MTPEFKKSIKKMIAKRREIQTKKFRNAIAQYLDGISYRNYLLKGRKRPVKRSLR